MARDRFLGVDVGTSGVKAILVEASGEVVGAVTVPLTLDTPRPGWAQQDPEAWWEASVAAIRAVLTASPGSVAGVGLTGQMHSSVFLDGSGRVIRPALLWCDGRTSAQCGEITARAGGEERLREWVRNPALEGFTLPKILWLRDEEPAAFERLASVLLAKDFVRYRLTGVLATEPSDASGTLLFDPAAGGWSRPMLETTGLPESLLPELGASAEILGTVTPGAAAATGLAAGTPVVGGGADNACGAAGVGVVREGEAVASWGTSGTMLAPVSDPRVDPGLRAHTFCHVAPRTWYVMGVVLSAGGAFAWYRDRLAEGRSAAGRAGDPEHGRRGAGLGPSAAAAPTGESVHLRPLSAEGLNDEAARAPRGAGGVLFLPYLQGDRTPHRDAAARGAFLGLSLAHDRSHLSRAVLEGICFAMRDSLEVLGELGLGPETLLLTGGGARSEFVRSLQAEVYGLPVATVDREEGPAYGAALLAAVGVGAFDDLAAATRATVTRSAPRAPSVDAHEAYREPYARFRAAWPAARAWGG
ncbi:MAG: xylulokinase [Gemmatimonadota bacterium]